MYICVYIYIYIYTYNTKHPKQQQAIKQVDRGARPVNNNIHQ